MRVLQIVDERMEDFYLPSLMVVAIECDWKCALDGGFSPSVCQNNLLSIGRSVEISPSEILAVYRRNPITKCLLFGGLEPILQFQEVMEVIRLFRREFKKDTIVIYTGYNREEIMKQLQELQKYQNIIMKFGRYIPGQQPHFDAVLGVMLASDNQYGERIS